MDLPIKREKKKKSRQTKTQKKKENILELPVNIRVIFTRDSKIISQKAVIKKLSPSENVKYIGETLNDLPTGFGILTTQTFTYKGLWKDGLQHGYGVLTFPSQNVTIKGIFENGEVKGFCEKKVTKKSAIIKITGEVFSNNFENIIIIHNTKKNKVYEGEVGSKEISIGKIYEIADPIKYFYIGEVKNYKKFFGHGIMVKTGSFAYIGEFKKQQMAGYTEMYFSDGTVLISYLVDSMKYGKAIRFGKDGKFLNGNYYRDLKHGPFYQYSNCYDISKGKFKMEFFIYGLKCKSFDKVNDAVRYVEYYYPEFRSVYCSKQSFVTKIAQMIQEERKGINNFITNEEEKENMGERKLIFLNQGK